MQTLSSIRPLALLLVFVSVIAGVDETGASSERVTIPVPKQIVYAGQIISPDILRGRPVPVSYLDRVSVFVHDSQIIGKVARTTLVPNRPIPTNFVTEPYVVKVNTRAVMRYQSGALTITAEVMPLNSAQTGQLVRARNLQTGVLVYGTARSDGTIIVEAR